MSECSTCRCCSCAPVYTSCCCCCSSVSAAGTATGGCSRSRRLLGCVRLERCGAASRYASSERTDSTSYSAHASGCYVLHSIMIETITSTRKDLITSTSTCELTYDRFVLRQRRDHRRATEVTVLYVQWNYCTLMRRTRLDSQSSRRNKIK